MDNVLFETAKDKTISSICTCNSEVNYSEFHGNTEEIVSSSK